MKESISNDRSIQMSNSFVYFGSVLFNVLFAQFEIRLSEISTWKFAMIRRALNITFNFKMTEFILLKDKNLSTILFDIHGV